MEEYKETNDQILKKIPSKWIITKLKYVSALKTGGTPPDKFGISNEGDYPWITAQDMNDNLQINNFSQFISKEAINKCNYKLFPKDSVLLVCIASVGKLGILNRYAYANQQITAIIPNYMINPRYLLYYTDAYSEKISKDAANNVVPIINSKYLNNLTICLPTKYEQNNIADFLDKKVDKIDKILEDLNKQIEILNNYKKSIITEAVTKGIYKNRKYKSTGIEWIQNIPEDWSIKRIINISYLKGRIGWQGLTTDEYIEEGPFLVTGIDFYNGNIDWKNCVHVSEWRFEQAPEIQLKENDLLITKDGTVGKVAITQNTPAKVTLNSGVLLIRPIENNLYENRFLYYVLLSDEFWKWFDYINSGNTTIIHLYQNVFAKFKFALPSIIEQKEIINYLDEKCSNIDKTIKIKQKQIDKLENYKKSLIYEYVTGKKRVKEE